ncbi:MAG: phage holin family protein [Sphingomicrobium sp.]
MLKPADPAPPDNERAIGDIVSDLVDDAKAYAQAELDLAKAIAADKARGLKIGAILLVASLVIAFGAITALSVGIFALLATFLGPLLGGIVAFLLIGAVAGLLAWAGIARVRDSF